MSEYVRDKSKYKGIKTQCISCEKARTDKNKKKEIDKNAMKICVKCKIEKNVEEFYKDHNCKLGVKPDCKICCDKVKKKYREINKEILTVKNKEYKERPENKEREKAVKKLYRENNAEKIKQYRKINKESIIEKNKVYRAKPEVKERVKIRLLNNIQVRLTKICRNRYYKSLRKNTINKSDNIIELIGCNISELKIYLENKFSENMSWDNYGLYGWQYYIIKIFLSRKKFEKFIII